MLKKKVQNILSMFMLFIMIVTLLAGCGGGRDKEAGTNSTDAGNTDRTENSGDAAKAEGTDENTAMGRYVESVINLSDAFSGYENDIFRLADGSLIITDGYSDLLISEDNGITWEADKREWRTRMIKNQTFILDMAVGKDGTVAVIYDADEDIQEEEEEENTYYRLAPKLLIIKPDGTEVTVEIATEEADIYIHDVWIAGNGRIFVSVLGSGNIYEVKEDGTSEKFLTVTSRPGLVQFQGNLMIIDGSSYDYDGLLIYDMESKQYIEDQVINDFINENYKNRDYDNGSSDNLYFFPGEEGILYLAGDQGLYRHVIGGSAIEQVIDGSLSTFSNPAYWVRGMLLLDNNEFIALFNSGRLVRFTYDANVPTVPAEKLKVYSLKENDTVRQAVALYQTANPEVFVEYEVGMGEDSSVTREDALKSLNTKIMAGDGPDVLILDNMPVDSYIQKGLLHDLSSVLNDLGGEEELYSNIINAFQTENKIYSVPCEIQLPVIMGKEEYVSQMDSLAGIAGAMEEMREDNPGKNLLSICTEKGIMRLFSMISVPFWKTENGEPDREEITEFLTQVKRIYDAQLDGLPQEEIEQYSDLNENYLEVYGFTRDDSPYLRTGVSFMDYLAEGRQLICGTLYYPSSYAELTSVQKVKGYENDRIIPMKEKVFLAQTMAGINAASANIGRAEAFIKMLLGKENQSNLFNGLPVNKAVFEESLITPDEVYSFSLGNADGLYVELEVVWPDEEQLAAFKKWMEAAAIPYIEDDLLEEAVYEEGIDYLKGNAGLEETVNAIEKKVALYMAE